MQFAECQGLPIGNSLYVRIVFKSLRQNLSTGQSFMPLPLRAILTYIRLTVDCLAKFPHLNGVD